MSHPRTSHRLRRHIAATWIGNIGCGFLAQLGGRIGPLAVVSHDVATHNRTRKSRFIDSASRRAAKVMIMKRSRLPSGIPTLAVTVRVPLELGQAIDDAARKLNVTKSKLLVNVLDYELGSGEPPPWWDEWVNRQAEQQASLLESEGGL